MALQIEKIAGFISPRAFTTILTEKLYFGRSVLLQVFGTEQNAREAVFLSFALPFEWPRRSFAAPEDSRAKIPEWQSATEKHSEVLLPFSYTHT